MAKGMSWYDGQDERFRDKEKDLGIDFDELVRETDEAYLIKVDKKDYWVPKSQTRIYLKSKKIYGPEWLFEKKGLV